MNSATITTPELIRRSSELLRAMYDEPSALFSYSSHRAEGHLTNDFNHPLRLRYTVNSLAGIQRAQEVFPLGWDLPTRLDRFLTQHLAHVSNLADKGLLLSVLAGQQHPAQQPLFAELQRTVRSTDELLKLNLQELCWMLTGLTRYAEVTQQTEAIAAAERLFKTINRHFVNRDTLFPRFTLQWWRKPFTSFGAVAYHLKALVEYARAFNDRYAEALFKESTERMIGFQGPQGEWPWFYNVNSMSVVDWYPVYSVHQDAMAMLFLLPALDLRVADAEQAVRKSFRWLFGENQLGTPLLTREPFFISRSIRRRGRAERGKRYSRAVLLGATGQSAPLLSADQLEVNPECRSYHLGWILYAWAPRRDFTEFTELKLSAS